jgi:hypothetical protein
MKPLLQTQIATPLSRTRFRKSVKEPTLTMLKSGKANKKLGGSVRKGMWKGLPIFSLTLEERASCPPTCEQWTNCYGNNMPFAHRYAHTNPEFEGALRTNLEQLATVHKQGFVVRLHVLGDFYSSEYVRFWMAMMLAIPGLRVFGYTHHRHNTDIGKLISNLNVTFPDRWRVRFSDDLNVEFRSQVVASPQQATGVVCPEQLGKAASCGNCAYCWHSEKPVFFVEH